MERILSYVLNKIFTALLSSFVQGLFFLILAIVRSWFVQYDSELGPIWAFPLLSQVYSIPAYVLAGVPSSMFIDALTYRIHFSSRFPRYFIRVILYALAGTLVVVLFQHFTQTGTVVYVRKPTPIADALRIVIAGALPALLFYHISLLLRWARSGTKQFHSCSESN